MGWNNGGWISASFLLSRYFLEFWIDERSWVWFGVLLPLVSHCNLCIRIILITRYVILRLKEIFTCYIALCNKRSCALIKMWYWSNVSCFWRQDFHQNSLVCRAWLISTISSFLLTRNGFGPLFCYRGLLLFFSLHQKKKSPRATNGNVKVEI